MQPSDYKKAAEEWFASLLKHPQPQAGSLKRQEAGENSRVALRDHKRRGREAEKLGRLASRARSLWDRIMGGEESEAA